MEVKENEGVVFARAISFIFGWTYFILWSISFYPQIFTNIRRKGTQGFSLDFPIANILGLSCYTIYAALLLFSPVVRAQYADRHHGNTPTTQLNDFVYGAHAVIVEIVVLSQFFPRLWGFRKDAWQRPSWTMCIICTLCLAYLTHVVLFTAFNPGAKLPFQPNNTWLDATYAFGNVKLFLTVVKYLPQAILNYKRKDTSGFAILAVVMDTVGSVLSLSQLAIDSALQRDWGGVTGNPAKFALGNVSLVFDVVYMMQHWVFYRGAKVDEEGQGDGDGEREREPLLGEPR